MFSELLHELRITWKSDSAKLGVCDRWFTQWNQVSKYLKLPLCSLLLPGSMWQLRHWGQTRQSPALNLLSVLMVYCVLVINSKCTTSWISSKIVSMTLLIDTLSFLFFLNNQLWWSPFDVLLFSGKYDMIDFHLLLITDQKHYLQVQRAGLTNVISLLFHLVIRSIKHLLAV